jgi:hypothetical protein
MEPGIGDYSNSPQASEEKPNISILNPTFYLRFVVPQECVYPPVILPRGIYRGNYSLITFHKILKVHLRNKIDCPVSVRTCRFAFQSALPLQSFPQGRIRDCVQQTDHGRHDPCALNEIYLTLEGVLGIIIESYNESSHHLHPILLDGITQILQFAYHRLLLLILLLDLYSLDISLTVGFPSIQDMVNIFQ